MRRLVFIDRNSNFIFNPWANFGQCSDSKVFPSCQMFRLVWKSMVWLYCRKCWCNEKWGEFCDAVVDGRLVDSCHLNLALNFLTQLHAHYYWPSNNLTITHIASCDTYQMILYSQSIICELHCVTGRFSYTSCSKLSNNNNVFISLVSRHCAIWCRHVIKIKGQALREKFNT